MQSGKKEKLLQGRNHILISFIWPTSPRSESQKMLIECSGYNQPPAFSHLHSELLAHLNKEERITRGRPSPHSLHTSHHLQCSHVAIWVWHVLKDSFCGQRRQYVVIQFYLLQIWKPSFPLSFQAPYLSLSFKWMLTIWLIKFLWIIKLHLYI